MTALSWFAGALAFRGIEAPSPLIARFETGGRELGPWWLLAERSAVANRESLAKQFPGRDILPFARRGDRDAVACLVVRDPRLTRGSVVVIHDGAMPGVEIEETFDSLAEWFSAATSPASA